MRTPLRKSMKLTQGERARALAFVLVGICSGALGYLAVLHIDNSALFDSLSWYQTWIVAGATIGGLVALFLSGDRMGQSGLRGAMRSLAGGLWVTFVGALVGGSLSLPLYGTMFGPFIVFVTLIGAPLLAMLWVFNLIGVHLLLRIYQEERDSIFSRENFASTPQSNAFRGRLPGRLT